MMMPVTPAPSSSDPPAIEANPAMLMDRQRPLASRQLAPAGGGGAVLGEGGTTTVPCGSRGSVCAVAGLGLGSGLRVGCVGFRVTSGAETARGESDAIGREF